MSNMTQSSFLKAINQCTPKDLQCRWSEIGKVGLVGFKSSFQGVGTKPAQSQPAPSFSAIEKAMKVVFSLLGKVLGKQFSLATKAFRLMYRPHFQLLKMLDASMTKYWQHIEFVTWATETVHALDTSVRSYLTTTRQFKLADSLTYFNRLDKKASEQALKDLTQAAYVLHEFDDLLLQDIEELHLALLDGLDQVLQMKPAKNVSDQIALSRIIQDLQFMYLAIQKTYPSTLRSLVEHRKSWQFDYAKAATESNQSPPSTKDVMKKLSDCIDRVADLRSGK